MTPYQRVKGKEWRMSLPAFDESVDYRKRTRHKLEARWARGVFLGVNVDSTEKIVGAADGVYIVQASCLNIANSERALTGLATGSAGSRAG